MRVLLWASRLPAMTAVVAGVALSLVIGGVAPAASARVGAAVPPRSVGELDCNGLSPIQHAVKSALPCLDPRGNDNGRFEENGHYIGHDEPSIRFISRQPGSGNKVTFSERLPVEPAALPTVRHPGKDVTHSFELTIAPWFSMDVCDPHSSPLRPCKPESDANAPSGSNPGGGAAFVELQFYPPGFAPFADSISCDNTHWCSALAIDSLECGSVASSCNQQCLEPANFSFVQTNGVPPGPPSPQLTDSATFTPDGHTLLMNPGDRITARMFNARIPGGHALEVRETDWSTGQSGYMIASAANGFMNTNPKTCAGTPFNFQPEYSTARAGNILPWSFGPYMINTQFEIGHFEPCTALSGAATASLGNVTDTYYKHCSGPYEPARDRASAGLEPNDAPCYPFGDTHGGTSPPNLVTGCDVFTNAIGDLDYDGTPYRADWPNSVTPDRHPSAFLQQQPVTAGGRRYPAIQFVTDASATELNTNCNTVTGSGCVLPPKGPGHFYPFWTQARVGGSCVWEFGNMRNGNTFGGDAQYGSVGPGTLGAFAGPVRRNPNC